MSANRKHTDVLELGWLDFLLACGDDPFVRVEGHDYARTMASSRLVRFNRAVQVLPSTRVDGDLPRVHAYTLRRIGEKMQFLVPTSTQIVLAWDEVDWVSWDPGHRPDGRRFKITTTGQSVFGQYDLWEGTRLVERATGRVMGDFEDRTSAVAHAVRLLSRVA